MSDAVREQLAEYVRLHPTTSAIEAVAHVGADPARWVDVVEEALNTADPVAAVRDVSHAPEPADGAEEDPDPDRPNPGGDADASGSATPEPRDDAGGGADPPSADPPSADPPSAEEPVATVAEESYPPTIVDREYWVNWILDGAGRKRPVAPWQTGHAYPVEWNGDLPDDDRPETEFSTAKRWADFDLADADLRLPEDAASDALETGILLPNDRPDREECITLIDWDDVRDPDTEEIHPVAADYIQRFGGYVEVSTSGEGLHQFVLGGLRKRGKFIAPIDGEPFVGDDLPQVEIYDGGRHVAMTGRHVAGTDDDVLDDGQELIDDLVTEFADAEKDAGHRRYAPESGDAADGDDAADVDHVPAPETGEYHGPTAEELRATKPDDRTLTYHAAVETFYRGGGNSGGYAHIQNWRLEGFAAALGERDGLTAEQIKADLGGRYLDETPVEQGCVHRTPERVDYGFNRAVNGRLEAPAAPTLAEYGVLPPSLDDADADAEPVAPLSLERLDALNDDDDRRRAARKRAPSTTDARGRLRDAVFREMRAGNTTVLDAPTALGKSHTVAAEPWRRRESTTGGAPVIQFHQTRDARDEAADATRNSSATGAVLRGRKEVSPVARGDHDPVEDPDAEDTPDQIVTVDGEPASVWFDRMCDDRGLPFSTALALARERNDQGLDELPPVGEEDPAVAQWDGLPRDDDGEPAVDVIHATHQFAHVPSLRSHTNVILDEQPDYRLDDLTDQQVRDMVNAYLRAADAPVSHFEGFVMLARNDDLRGDAAAERDALEEILHDDVDLPAEWYAETDGAHALAPDLTRAIWNGLRYEEPDRNGLRSAKVYHEPPRFDADKDGYAAGTWLSIVLDDGDHTTRTIRTTPDFSQARAVIGLDAHPSMPMWELNGPPGIVRDAVLDPTERRLWRRYERGLTVAQIGDATRPRSGSDALNWMNDDRVRAVLETLRDHYGDGFKTALSTKQTEPAIRRLLADVTGSDVRDVRDQLLHYGEEKSRNDFAEEDAGYVYGCMDPGDKMIVNALAELGLDATPARLTEDDVTEDGAHLCGDCGGDGCVDCDGTGRKREKGRTFDGDDADTAAAVLASVRENHVAQAAGRYAREPTDPESRATVFVDTNAAPTGFVDLEVPGVEWLASDLQRTIVDALADRPTATTRQIADVADCTKEHARNTLARLEDHGLVDREKRAGPHGADVYQDAGADAAIVDLGGTTNDALLDSNRWSLAIHDRHAREEDAAPPGGPSSTPIDAAGAGDTPPDPGD